MSLVTVRDRLLLNQIGDTYMTYEERLAEAAKIRDFRIREIEIAKIEREQKQQQTK